MKSKFSFYIFFIFLISYSQEKEIDSLKTSEYEKIDFHEELNKFKDSIPKTIFPQILFEEFSKLSSDVIIENTESMNKLYQLSKSNIKINNNNNRINTKGSISRGIILGNNQNSVLKSELDLQISGELNENIKIKASIQDSNIPLQNNGYSQQIDEFDQIFIQIYSDEWSVRGGDIDINQNLTFFGNFDKRIQGLTLKTEINDSFSAEVAGALVKGKYKKSEILTQNGNQGPYKLVGQNGELYVLIVSGSESVFVNGKKIERGLDKDYTINYNAGEIIFNPTFPIMSDSRVVVEYQVSEKNYNSFIGFGKFQIKQNRVTHNISLYNENDVKNQPILQNISENQLEALSNAGDNDELMYVPSGTLTPYNENRILYKREIVNGVEIFIYSNNQDDELYDVIFTNVGNNEGNYVLLSNNAVENIYEYVEPINGESQGDFEPLVKLVAPEKLQLLIYNTEYESKKGSIINFELAASKKDENLFSSIGDSNNNGFASKLNYKSQYIINESKLKAFIDLNYIENTFQPIERIFDVEFNRDWDLNKTIIRNSDQLFSNIGLDLINKKIGTIKYGWENLKYYNHYNGIKNSISFNSNNIKNLRISSNTSFMESNQNQYSSNFTDSNNKIDISYENGWIELTYNNERKKSNGNTNLNTPDFGQQQYQIKKGFGNPEKSFVEVGYLNNNNDSIVDGNLAKVNSQNSFFIKSQLIKNKKSNLNIYVNKTNIKSFNQNSDEDFLNTKLIYNQKILKNIVDSNLYYETNSGNLPQQEFTYLEVEPGLGNYKWIDVNENNIQELEEFEIAIFEDEGKYIRVLLPNQIFIRTYQNKLNYSMRLNFLKWKNSNRGFERFISKISNQFQYSMDKKTNLNSNSEIEFNPFVVSENGLLAYNYSLKNTIYFNKAKQRYSLIFTYLENKSKNNFSFGSTSGSRIFSKLNFIHKIDDFYLIELIGNREKKINWSENFSDKNYNIEETNLNPKITYFYGENNRLNFFYKYSNMKNSIGNQEYLKQQNFGISIFLNQVNNRGFTSEFNYFKNKFNGQSNSIISYVMMNGLQKGENYTWSLKYQRKLSKLIDINFVYLGRKSNSIRTIHNGSIQLKAIF